MLLTSGQSPIATGGSNVTLPLFPSYREIPLTQGQVAKVSPHRYEEISQWKWYAVWNKCTQSFYAVRNSRVSEGSPHAILMHRYILGLARDDSHEGDHENHDTLDNQDFNLRVANYRQQSGNKRMRRDNTTGFKGVTRNHNRYRAYIFRHGKQTYLGSRSTAEAAYRELYVPAAKEYFGEFAHLQPPSPIDALPIAEL